MCIFSEVGGEDGVHVPSRWSTPVRGPRRVLAVVFTPVSGWALEGGVAPGGACSVVEGAVGGVVCEWTLLDSGRYTS